jgi:hypothetical protein
MLAGGSLLKGEKIAFLLFCVVGQFILNIHHKRPIAQFHQYLKNFLLKMILGIVELTTYY